MILLQNFLTGSELGLYAGGGVLFLAIIIATIVFLGTKNPDHLALISVVGIMVAFAAGFVSCMVQDVRNSDVVMEQFEEYYDARIIDGTLYPHSKRASLDVYFEDTGDVTVCTVTIENATVSGFCDDGRTL